MTEARIYINALLKLNSNLSNKEIETATVSLNLNTGNLIVDEHKTYTLSKIEIEEIVRNLGQEHLVQGDYLIFKGKCAKQIKKEDKEQKLAQLHETLDSLQDHLDFLRSQKDFLFEEILETVDDLENIYKLIKAFKGEE